MRTPHSKRTMHAQAAMLLTGALGCPNSTASVVFSRLWLPRTEMVWVPLVLLIATLICHLFFMPSRLAALVGLGLGYRFLISAVLPVPLRFVMGMPFPTGLRALDPVGRGSSEQRSAADNAVEWAWATNAAASVLGSVLATVIAIRFGLNVTLACGAGSYLVALLLTSALHSKATQNF